MKIASINSNYFLNHTKLNNIKPNNNIAMKNSSDVFVREKSCSFTGKKVSDSDIEGLFQNLTDLVLNSESVSLDEVEKLSKKVLPDVAIKDMNQINYNQMIPDAGAIFTQNARILPVRNSSVFVTDDKTVYVDCPKFPSEVEKVKFLDSLLHELTHAKQESNENTSFEGFMNKSLGKTKDAFLAKQCMSYCVTAFKSVDSQVGEAFSILLGRPSYLPKVIDSKQDIDMPFKRDLDMSAEQYFTYTISNMVKRLSPKQKNIVLKYVKQYANAEKEAYTVALNSDKKLLGYGDSITDYDVRIDLYDTVINVIDKLIK